MKKFIVSITMVISLLLSNVGGALAKDYSNYPQKFWDVSKDHWAFDYISELVDKGVISGYEDGSFRPNNTVTRAEWAKIMVLASGITLDTSNNVNFTDMSNHWANMYVNTAKDYLSAYNNGLFKPDQAAVREDVTVSMVKLKGYNLNEVDYAYLNTFSDVNSISNSLKSYVALAVEKGLISGFEDNTFRGQDTLTRAEAATLLWRAFQYGNNDKVAGDSVVTVPEQYNPPVNTEKHTPSPDIEQQKPIVTEEPKETPDIKSDDAEKELNNPYIMDTLTKANIDNSVYSYTNDGDSVYYVENNNVIKVNAKSKNKEEILNAEDLVVDTDEYTLSDFNINNICYDNHNNRLLVQGHYSSTKSINKVNNDYLYEVKGDNITVITDSYPSDYNYNYAIVGTLSNGDYVTVDTILDCNTFDKKEYFSGNVNVAEEVNGNLYYFANNIPYGDGGNYEIALCSYDYMKTSSIWNGKAYAIYGLSDKGFITEYDDNSGWYIKFCNFRGKELYKITDMDLYVADRTAVNFDNTLQKYLVVGDNIVFYDETAKAFRIISENK